MSESHEKNAFIGIFSQNKVIHALWHQLKKLSRLCTRRSRASRVFCVKICGWPAWRPFCQSKNFSDPVKNKTIFPGRFTLMDHWVDMIVLQISLTNVCYLKFILLTIGNIPAIYLAPSHLTDRWSQFIWLFNNTSLTRLQCFKSVWTHLFHIVGVH